ncbi:nicotinamide riboside transporter PnuC [Inquilinus sp. Marseille-Q2685]|uniref:nicotinamide riboside transporter PnuC n=1 Tax=Inquilinus sp. Marseille-Q2685 TaxID=2866581 RepID=UPI001CE3F5A0|nr:nicotinamide riboside transporter PnuC [Inquilinus sp. Marseille-Q2685]
MPPIEIVATLLGLANVALIIRRSVWNYPFGVAMVVLYGKIFFDVKLYSDALLQVFFLVVQLAGWWGWLRRRGEDGLVRVESSPTRDRILAVAATALLSLALGHAMAAWTDAALPHWDAAIAAMSVTAQTLLALRRIENWLFWIATDVVAIGVYAAKGLVLTAGLYGIFLVLATLGLLQWLRHLEAGPAAEAAR